MKFNLQKIVWIVSFIIFLILFYNLNILERIVDIVFQKSTVVQVDEYITPKETLDSINIGIMTEESGVESNLEESGVESNLEPLVNEFENSDKDLTLKVEKLFWEIEQMEENITDLKIQITSLSSEKNNTIDSIIAIIGALTPLLLPIITKKFRNGVK